MGDKTRERAGCSKDLMVAKTESRDIHLHKYFPRFISPCEYIVKGCTNLGRDHQPESNQKSLLELLALQ